VIADALSCKLVLENGVLTSKITPEEPQQLPAERNILTYAGPQALRQRAVSDWP
jgi:hypothetical protein